MDEVDEVVAQRYRERVIQGCSERIDYGAERAMHTLPPSAARRLRRRQRRRRRLQLLLRGRGTGRSRDHLPRRRPTRPATLTRSPPPGQPPPNVCVLLLLYAHRARGHAVVGVRSFPARNR